MAIKLYIFLFSLYVFMSLMLHRNMRVFRPVIFYLIIVCYLFCFSVLASYLMLLINLFIFHRSIHLIRNLLYFPSTRAMY